MDGWAGSYYVALDGFEHMEICLPNFLKAGVKGMCYRAWPDISISKTFKY